MKNLQKGVIFLITKEKHDENTRIELGLDRTNKKYAIKLERLFKKR